MLDLVDRWTNRWPEGPPVPWLLRGALHDRWIRFHSLPLSKRYADTADETAEVLRRHLTVLDDLGAGPAVLVSTARWEPPDLSYQLSRESHPEARLWYRVEAGPDEENDITLQYTEWAFPSEQVEWFLTRVADDQASGALIAPPDFAWLYCPYDGGADVFFGTTLERDRLAQRHAAWLSSHPAGL